MILCKLLIFLFLWSNLHSYTLVRKDSTIYARNLLKSSLVSKSEQWDSSLQAVNVTKPVSLKKVDHVISLLALYEKEHGSLEIPTTFKVPSCEPWPSDSWGLLLGSKVVEIRRGRAFTSKKAKAALIEVGYYDDIVRKRARGRKPSTLKVNLKRTKSKEGKTSKQKPSRTLRKSKKMRILAEDVSALVKVYKSIHNHTLIPQDFKVPSNDRWPQKYWNVSLGVYTNRYRIRYSKNQIPSSFVEELESLGFVWNSVDYKFRLLCECMMIYRNLYGSNIHVSFAVPYDQTSTNISESCELPELRARWPKDMQGYKLGVAVQRMRHGYLYATPKYHEQVRLLGLYDFLFPTESPQVQSLNKKFTSTRKIVSLNESELSFLLSAFQTYSSCFPNQHTISTAFVIDRILSSQSSWDDNLIGLKLGKVYNFLKRAEVSKNPWITDFKLKLKRLSLSFKHHDANMKSLMQALPKALLTYRVRQADTQPCN
jgi:hypothetical protein